MKYTLTLALALSSVALVSASEKKKTTAAKKTIANNTSVSTKTADKKDDFIYSGPVEIQAYNATKAQPAPVGNEYLDYIGKNLNDQSVQNVITALPGDYDVSNLEGNLYYIWRSTGIIMKFDNKNKLQQIRFMNGKEFMGSFCNAYNKQMPQNLTFSMTRYDVEQNLSKPVDISNPSGDERVFATYSIYNGNYNVVVTYNTNSNQEMNAGIEDILIMKPTATANYTPNSNTAVSAAEINKIQSISNDNSTNNISIDNVKPASYIGKTQSDPAVKSYIENLGDNVQVIKYDESTQFVNKDAGIVMNFDNSEKLASVMFTSSKTFLGQPFKQYQGEMPADLNFNLTREQVEKKLGAPAQTSNNDKDNFWAMYSIHNGTDAVYITYNTKNADNTSATISDIRVEKLK